MFEDAINARVEALGVKIGDICDALGWSRSAWGTAKKRSNLRFGTLQRIALVLAIPVEVLVRRDAAVAACQHVPDWRWLDAFAQWRADTDAAHERQTDVPVPDWHDFEDTYRKDFR